MKKKGWKRAADAAIAEAASLRETLLNCTQAWKETNALHTQDTNEHWALWGKNQETISELTALVDKLRSEVEWRRSLPIPFGPAAARQVTETQAASEPGVVSVEVT